MAYSTGLRLLAAACSLTVVGLPFGIMFWWLARKKERERERELELMEQAAGENVD